MAITKAESGPKRRPKVAILLCDMQEPHRDRTHGFDVISKSIQKLLKAAALLKIPVHTTVQDAERLGPTVSELDALLPDKDKLPVLSKSTFSMFGAPGLEARFSSEGGNEDSDPDADADCPWRIAIVGIEAHVCVMQTAIDSLRAGHETFVLADAVGSGNAVEAKLALHELENLRVGGNGPVKVTSSESFLFGVMRDADIPEYRDVINVMKEAAEDTKEAMARVDKML